MKRLLVVLLSLTMLVGARADEGMWMLPLIKKLNIQKINGMGCALTADQIYSDKDTSLKDAVIVFGAGCSGVVVSNQGLVFTNHHCGFEAIQQRSSVEHNYLRDGFAAKELTDEIPCPGLSVKFVVRIEDMTERVLSQIPENMTGKARTNKVDSITEAIEKEAVKDSKLVAKLKPFYSGNEFYLFVWQEFTDVRLAFTPPNSIGKFGGDTDNWMWPRHTGDFSVFRVYSAPNGAPADYSKDNVPYVPKRFAAISNQGYVPGDYTMIMGNPGTTTRYLSSWGVNYRMNATNMARIEVRGAKQDVWKSFMRADEAINIAYASKYARSSNYWKNSIGMNKAISRLDVIGKKKELEKEFTAWVNASAERKAKYSTVLTTLEEGYGKLYPYGRAYNYLTEALSTGVEMPRLAMQANELAHKNISTDSIQKSLKKLYKDYYPAVDEAAMAVLLEVYKKSVTPDALPEVYKTIAKKFKGDYKKYAAWLYKKSAFTSLEKISKAVANGEINFNDDPAIDFGLDISKTSSSIRGDEYMNIAAKIKDAERLFENGLKAMAAEKGIAIHPDANSTMRLTYGKVGGYDPADAVSYDYYTTTKGILEKEKPGDYEFDVPKKMKDNILAKNYGAYLDKKTGEMHVAFLSNNDITGGNSGSPIFNGKGELLGLAFDGNWEAMSGDIVFEPDLQRTISVDVRYILFVMDKVYGAERLIKELEVK